MVRASKRVVAMLAAENVSTRGASSILFSSLLQSMIGLEVGGREGRPRQQRRCR